jgi:SAM-dependent methyltransferase
VATAPTSDPDRYVHPDADRLAAWRRVYERYLVVEDLYPGVAARFERHGVARFAEIGGGRGPVAALLAGRGVATAVVDLDERMTEEAQRPVIRGDLRALPLAGMAFDGVAAVNCLYFLEDPAAGIAEARRVLRPGGLFVASSPSRYNDPELEGVDPRWGTPSSFDSEEAPALVGGVFGHVEVDAYDVVAYELPDAEAIADYLHAVKVPEWETVAARLRAPMAITKRGAQVWAVRES